jgi:hypothetical protein
VVSRDEACETVAQPLGPVLTACCCVSCVTAGLDDKGIEGPALLEADQGDTLVGVVSRDEAADTVLAALAQPDAAGKTLELRRGEGSEAQGKSMTAAAFNRLFLKLALGEQDLTGLDVRFKGLWGLGFKGFRVGCLEPELRLEKGSEAKGKSMSDAALQAVPEAGPW